MADDDFWLAAALVHTEITWWCAHDDGGHMACSSDDSHLVRLRSLARALTSRPAASLTTPAAVQRSLGGREPSGCRHQACCCEL
jgi:hypothetical protein